MNFNKKKIILLLLLISNNMLFANLGDSNIALTELFYDNGGMQKGVFIEPSSIDKVSMRIFKDNKNIPDAINVKIGSINYILFEQSNLRTETKEMEDLSAFLTFYSTAKKKILKNFKNIFKKISNISPNKEDWFINLGLLSIERKEDKPTFKVIVGVIKKDDPSKIITIYETDKIVSLEMKTKNPIDKNDKDEIKEIRDLIKRAIENYQISGDMNIEMHKNEVLKEIESNEDIEKKLIDVINYTANPDSSYSQYEHQNFVVVRFLYQYFNGHSPHKFNNKLHTIIFPEEFIKGKEERLIKEKEEKEEKENRTKEIRENRRKEIREVEVLTFLGILNKDIFTEYNNEVIIDLEVLRTWKKKEENKKKLSKILKKEISREKINKWIIELEKKGLKFYEEHIEKVKNEERTKREIKEVELSAFYGIANKDIFTENEDKELIINLDKWRLWKDKEENKQKFLEMAKKEINMEEINKWIKDFRENGLIFYDKHIKKIKEKESILKSRELWEKEYPIDSKILIPTRINKYPSNINIIDSLQKPINNL